MIVTRKAEERGHANHGWLNTYHSFSFANYYDPNHMGFRSLRVINEDRVKGGTGFGTHGHRDWEIITYVLGGSLEHRDNMGHISIIQPGEVQRISAGTGILHSEYNHSPTEPVHFLQIWLFPNQEGLKPSYEQKQFDLKNNPGTLKLIAAPNAKNGAITIHQDCNLYAAVLAQGDTISYVLPNNRYAWIQVAKGSITVNGNLFNTSDSAVIESETNLIIEGQEGAEFLLFDLA